MGNKGSAGTLRRKNLKELVSQTHFSVAEIEALYAHFRDIASTRLDDGQIDRAEFREALALPDSLFVDRLFSLFDENEDGFINFTEFLCGLSILCVRGTLAEKTLFSFRLYDFDKDNRISNEELTSMLKTSLRENDIRLSPAQIEQVVRATFAEADANRDGFIDMDEYKALVDRNPAVLNNMTLDFARLIEGRLDGDRAQSSADAAETDAEAQQETASAR